MEKTTYILAIEKVGINFNVGNKPMTLAEVKGHFWAQSWNRRLRQKKEMPADMRILLEADLEYKKYSNAWGKITWQLKKQGLAWPEKLSDF